MFGYLNILPYLCIVKLRQGVLSHAVTQMMQYVDVWLWDSATL